MPIFALFLGGYASLLMQYREGSKEISDSLYARLAEMRRYYPDLEGLRSNRAPLTLQTLRRHIRDLSRALDSDMAHPARSNFLYNEGEIVQFFRFKHHEEAF